MSDIILSAAIQRYNAVAKKELRRWFEPNSCIASTRVTVDVFRALGFKAEPVAVYYQLWEASRGLLHVCGSQYEQAKKFTGGKSVAADMRKSGWDGHVVALIEDELLVDATWDGPLMTSNPMLPADDDLLYWRLPRPLDRDIVLDAKITHCSGLELNAVYAPVEDDSYQAQPAWEDDNTEIPTELILRYIRTAAPLPKDIYLVVVVRRRMGGYAIQRWKVGTAVDFDPMRTVLEDDAALAVVHERMEKSGMVRLKKIVLPEVYELWM